MQNHKIQESIKHLDMIIILCLIEKRKNTKYIFVKNIIHMGINNPQKKKQSFAFFSGDEKITGVNFDIII